MTEKAVISIKESWKELSSSTANLIKLVLGSVIIFTILGCLPAFFRGIEKRDGVVLHDWVLEHIPAYNVSTYIFIVIWGMSLLILYRAIHKPAIYILYCWSLIFITLLRISSISLIALNPPVGLIPLIDPLTGVFYGHAFITKDLFFSGHISILMLTYLCLEKKSDKTIGLISVIVVAMLLLVQHIHYTIDIVAAPIITYMCVSFTRKYIV